MNFALDQEKLARIQEIRGRLEIDLLELFMAYRYLPGEPTLVGDLLERLILEVQERAKNA